MAVRSHVPHGGSPRRSRVGGVCPDLVQGTRSQHITPPVAKKIEVYPADSQPGVSRDDQVSGWRHCTADEASQPFLDPRREKNAPERCRPSRLRFHLLVHIHNSQFNFPRLKIPLHRPFQPCLFADNTTLDCPCNRSRKYFSFSFS